MTNLKKIIVLFIALTLIVGNIVFAATNTSVIEDESDNSTSNSSTNNS